MQSARRSTRRPPVWKCKVENSVNQTAIADAERPKSSLSAAGKRRFLRLIAIAALTGAYTVAGPAPAQAVTTVGKQGSIITVTATGVGNNLNVRRAGSFYEVWDHVDGTRSLTGCSRGPSPSIMQCPAAGVTKIVVRTGAGNDRVYILNSVAVRTEIYGGDGNDRLISGGTGHDILHGEAGEDIIYGGPGPDYLVGGPNDDFLDGDDGNDVLSGGPGRDRVSGEEGINVVNGDEGNDRLFPGAPGSTANGGADDDTLVPDPAAGGTLSGGAGSDLVTYFYRTIPVRADLDGVRDDGAIGLATKDNILPDVERLVGGSGNDNLTGSAVANVIHGGAGGNDVLIGLGGNDYLPGGPGIDVIIGGTGRDRMEGNDGNDTLDARDDVRTRDVADGGRGTDTCYLNPVDIRVGCDIFP